MAARLYTRLLRAADLPVVKAVHAELFGFDIVVGDAALQDAVTSSRWLCLAAVQAIPGGGERLAGFVMSAVGTVEEFEQGDYDHGVDAEEHAGPSGRQMGLEQLSLNPADTTVNVCLLATLPAFRRTGVATQLFNQVINSARNARAKAIFLHVLDGNTAALSFYARFGFKVMGRVPCFYQLCGNGATADALLLRALVTEVKASGGGAGSAAAADVASPSMAAAYRSAAQRAAARLGDTGTTASAPPPKMRGLMGRGGSDPFLGPSSRTRQLSTAQPSASAQAPPRPPQEPPPSARSNQPAAGKGSSPAQEQAGTDGPGASGGGVLGAVFGGVLGALLPPGQAVARQGTDSPGASAQPAAGPPAQQLEAFRLNGEQLATVQGEDGEVYVIPQQGQRDGPAGGVSGRPADAEPAAPAIPQPVRPGVRGGDVGCGALPARVVWRVATRALPRLRAIRQAPLTRVW